MIRGEVLIPASQMPLGDGQDVPAYVDERSCRSVRITAPGVVVDWQHTPAGVLTFYPWQRVLWLAGQDGATEHELAQLHYIGT